ncbi:copper amine oxidase N-terminal domain-containing protein [Brevibacillus daliensis]|uniref:copper amine oxidase N-terminal domain-containing protein n=1 Tax=Brevibacillus daliensis TaxID=2892995 RepID=UPI001E3139FB|nr:copper amine oxidase N-terminal domain-containing protein [Brevibacillus daliensis]
MKSIIVRWTLFVFILLLIFQATNIVKADDDHGDDHKKSEKYEKHKKDEQNFFDWDDDDHDDDDWKNDNETYKNGTRSLYESNLVKNSFWNIWTREPSISLHENLPIQDTREVIIELNNRSEMFYIIPQNGQLLVKGEKIAMFLNAESTYYQQSKILEVSKDKKELIVRARSNAAYENMVKTPMPTSAFFYEESVYLPISVIANAFGYRVSWNAEKETIIFQEIL